MWCRSCNIETNESTCPVCGTMTAEDMPTEVFWCNTCRTPVIQEVAQADRGVCPQCKNAMKYLSTDLRPVFPEERLLIELLLGKQPNEYLFNSVWAANNRYYIDGNAVTLPNKLFQESDANSLRSHINEFSNHNCSSKQRPTIFISVKWFRGNKIDA